MHPTGRPWSNKPPCLEHITYSLCGVVDPSRCLHTTDNVGRTSGHKRHGPFRVHNELQLINIMYESCTTSIIISLGWKRKMVQYVQRGNIPLPFAQSTLSQEILMISSLGPPPSRSEQRSLLRLPSVITPPCNSAILPRLVACSTGPSGRSSVIPRAGR